MFNSLMMNFAKLSRDRQGNFAMLAAVLLPVGIVAGSLAVDTTNTLSMKAHLQNAADGAALATAAQLADGKLTPLQAKDYAAKFFMGLTSEDGKTFNEFSATPDVSVTMKGSGKKIVWEVEVAAVGNQQATQLARLMGRESLNVHVTGKSQSGSDTSLGSISMALVLDKSGSMDWSIGSGSSDGEANVVLGPDGLPLGSLNKMDVLKIAVTAMISEFGTTDPDGQYIRLGASSYNNRLRGKQSLTWTLGRVTNFVNTLNPEGGTDSTDAFKWGYERLMHPQEDAEHKKKSGQLPEKFLVFMTDGDNNYSSADTSTKVLCDNAKNDDIKIYTVAFAAPNRGKELLSYCASSPTHFFDAGNSAELIDAFKSIGMQASKIASRLTE